MWGIRGTSYLICWRELKLYGLAIYNLRLTIDYCFEFFVSLVVKNLKNPRSSFGFAQDGACVHRRLGLVVPRLYMVSGFKDFGVYSSSFVVADYEFFVRLCAFLLGVMGVRPIE